MILARKSRMDTETDFIERLQKEQAEEQTTIEIFAKRLDISPSLLSMTYSRQRRVGPTLIKAVIREYPDGLGMWALLHLVQLLLPPDEGDGAMAAK